MGVTGSGAEIQDLGEPPTNGYGPGIENFDIAARKTTKIAEGKTLEMRFETFNSLNHAQFNGQGSVDGNVNSPTFGKVLKASSPRIVQLGAKFTF